MGYNTTVEGEFHITPALTWTEIRDSAYNPDKADQYKRKPEVKLDVQQTTVDTDEGPLLRRTANAVIPAYDEEYKAYGLMEDIQALVDAFPGHTFEGYFECTGEDSGDLWRVVIRNGCAERIDPVVTWPDM